jgi:16S rRNA (cytidine1402-2'-O)-methyltransferase
MSSGSGTCYICPTPIGNLKDITLRVLEALESVELIACEDTRRTLKLLNAYNIKKSLMVFNEHTKAEGQKRILECLEAGQSVAVVSDAGMPGIADTGHELILACIERSIKLEVLPGATALINGLVSSGLPCQQFLFINYLPRKQGKLVQLLEKIKAEGFTICAYEVPHRLVNTLALLKEMHPDMEVCVCREMTKMHEENIRGNIETVYNYFVHRKVMGEITLIMRMKAEGENNDG